MGIAQQVLGLQSIRGIGPLCCIPNGEGFLSNLKLLRRIAPESIG